MVHFLKITIDILFHCRLTEISIDHASAEYSSLGVAHAVEQCRCPQGYIGTSCEVKLVMELTRNGCCSRVCFRIVLLVLVELEVVCIWDSANHVCATDTPINAILNSANASYVYCITHLETGILASFSLFRIANTTLKDLNAANANLVTLVMLHVAHHTTVKSMVVIQMLATPGTTECLHTKPVAWTATVMVTARKAATASVDVW